MEVEGIYRKSGGAKQIRDIQELFDEGQTPDLTDENKWNDINAITSVLKQYFRKLPDPLFTYQFHNDFIRNTCNYVNLIICSLVINIVIY